jgi:hypothetical protein
MWNINLNFYRVADFYALPDDYAFRLMWLPHITAAIKADPACLRV